MIPADEIHGVGEVGAIGGLVSGLALVLRPGCIERLRIAVGGRHPLPRDETEQPCARRLGIVLETGLLAQRRHQHRNRHAALALRQLRRLLPILEPAGLLVEHGAKIVDPARRSRTPGQRRSQCCNQRQPCNFRKMRHTHSRGLARKTERSIAGSVNPAGVAETCVGNEAVRGIRRILSPLSRCEITE